MIIKLKYRAIFWDNHQGGSGKPFDDELIYLEGESLTLNELMTNAYVRLEELENQTFYGEARFVELSVIPDD